MSTTIKEQSLSEDAMAPREATRVFVEAWRAYAAVPDHDRNKDRAWKAVRTAYGTFRAFLSDDESRAIWQEAKAAVKTGTASPNQTALYEFGEERTRKYRATDKYKEKRRAYDIARAKRPERKAQIQAARRRHKIKRAAAQREAANA